MKEKLKCASHYKLHQIELENRGTIFFELNNSTPTLIRETRVQKGITTVTTADCPGFRYS